jgi:hypothetical protein
MVSQPSTIAPAIHHPKGNAGSDRPNTTKGTITVSFCKTTNAKLTKAIAITPHCPILFNSLWQNSPPGLGGSSPA